MSQLSDATPAYRGYRLQALYSLFRILDQDGSEDLVFQPEKLEDLSIEDEKGNLLEVIQVKSGDLTLSSFKESFFLRIYPLIKKQKMPRIIIASFGKVGTELQQAIKGDGRERERVSKKIMEKCESFMLSDGEAKIILDKLELIFLKESELTEKVYSLLRDTFTGIDSYNAFDNLNYWLYRCSEKKSSITKNDVINKLQDIGKFVAERAAYHEEWFNSIIPIDDQQVNLNKSKLREEFYQGVSAKYDHILANTDVLRPNKIREIEIKFNESSVVIIHGASGQGKSTLAYRYLHEHFPNMWRFKVEIVQDRKHALSIARAITGHADVIKFPVAVYLDVSAKDSDWPDLVKQLSTHQNIKILVTIREEDYKRSSIQGFEVKFKEVDLTFDKSEACEIYQSLERGKTPPHFLCFEDAWDKFKGEGPLMEFTYLVTQGEALQNRLEEQVTRLYDEARNGKMQTDEIKLLTLVSIASSFDAHLKVKPLVDFLKLMAPRRTFELFDKEYLLRLNEDGSLVKGLHPIRSEILANLLTDPIMSPWAQHAIECLPLIYDPDVEIFLLYAFSRRRKDTKSLLIALNSWHPTHWVSVCGVIRALIWFGILEYVGRNQDLIQEAFEKSGTGFTFLLDSDVSDAIPGSTTSFMNIFCDTNQTDKNLQKIAFYRNRQTDKSQIFVQAKEWLSNMTVNPVIPLCNEDWSGMAEVSFWLRRFGITWQFSKRVPYLELEQAIEYLPLEVAADLILGLHEGYGEDFIAWRESNGSKLIRRFREETLTVNLQNKENKVDAHFVVELEMPADSEYNDNDIKEPGNYLHTEAMRRIKLLRKIIPDRDVYACQGHGHKIWNKELPVDDTRKTGISITQLPPKWLVSINSTFRGLAEIPYRPETWEEYSKSICKLRKLILSAAKCLVNSLETYFQRQKPDKLFGKIINDEEWLEYKQILSKPLLMPSCAVDEWGFIDEFCDSQAEENVIIRGPALQKHKPFLTSYRDYKRLFKNFLDQSEHSMVINQIRGKSMIDRQRRSKYEQKAIEGGFRPDFIRLSRINLSECIKEIPSFQRKFRRTFGQFLETSELNDLENQELTVLRDLWCMWYFFCNKPNLTRLNPREEFVKKIDIATDDIKIAIKERLSNISSENLGISVTSYDLFWEDKHAVWITIDGKNGVDVYNSVEGTFREIFKSVNDLINKDLTRLIFEMNWPLIIIVPKIQGKCLKDKAWRVSSATLLSSVDGNLNWFNLITQYTIPKDALIRLNIDVWDIPELEVANRLTQNVFNLSLQVASLKDLEKLTGLDDQGINQLNLYAQKLASDINTSAQVISDSAEKMENIFREIPPSDYNNHLNMFYSMRYLEEAGKYLMSPFNSQEEKTSEPDNLISEWKDRLEKGRMAFCVSNLFWASDMINNRNKNVH